MKNTTHRMSKKNPIFDRFSLVSMGTLAYCPALSGTRLDICQHVNNLLITRNNSGGPAMICRGVAPNGDAVIIRS